MGKYIRSESIFLSDFIRGTDIEQCGEDTVNANLERYLKKIEEAGA